MGVSAFSIVGGGGFGAMGTAAYLGNLVIYNDVTTDQTLNLDTAGGMIVYDVEDNIIVSLAAAVTGRMHTVLFKKGDVGNTPTIAVSGDYATSLIWVGNQINSLTHPIILSIACFEDTSKLYVAMAQQQ